MHRPNAHLDHVLTARDRAVLTYVGQRGCATCVDLQARFWPGSTLATCRARLRGQVRQGVLGTQRTECRGHSEDLFWLTPAGRCALPEQQRAALRCGRPTLAEQAHLLRTNDVLTRLERSARLISWSSEHVLKGELRRGTRRGPVADLAVTIERAGLVEHWLVEIDGAYYGAALARKIQGYGQAGSAVLWVVYSPLRLGHMRDQCRAYPSIRPVLFEVL